LKTVNVSETEYSGLREVIAKQQTQIEKLTAKIWELLKDKAGSPPPFDPTFKDCKPARVSLPPSPW
jgi:hypothetical protein